MIKKPISQNSKTAALFCALVCSCVFAGQPTAQLTGGGVKIQVNFSDQQQSRVVFVGIIPAPPGIDLNGVGVGIDVGGIQRSYILSPDGEGVATPDLFQMRPIATGYSFILSTLDNSLANAYQSIGIINSTVTNAPVSMQVSVGFQGTVYGATLMGNYFAQANITGKAFLGVIMAPQKDPLATIKNISTLAATPNPTQANSPVTIKGSVSLTNFTGIVDGFVNFGDRTKPIHAQGSSFQSMLKEGVTHTYTADGVYVARVTLASTQEIATTRLFVIVGDNWIVNSQSGAVGRLVKTAGGGVTIQVGIDNVPGAMNAQTNFLDMKGNSAGIPPTPPPTGGQMGLAPSNTFTLPGVYVAETKAISQAGGPLAMLRKTIVISTADVAASMVQNADGTEQAAPRDTSTTDSTISLSSMSGKFQFASSSSDTVTFSGSITLPAGFDPKSTTGNDITIAMGNVSDTVHLNAKNKFVAPSTQGYISKFTLTVPKLASGVAVGTETAKLALTMKASDLETKGFDTEGVTSSTRSDETGQTSVARFIQVDMLLGGKSYSSLIQVSYAVTSSSDFGTISGRK